MPGTMTVGKRSGETAVTAGAAARPDALEAALAPVVASFGAELVDLELPPGVVRLVVDAPGTLDLERLGEISRAVSVELDALGELAPRARYELEVSSPGVERRLRRPAHYVRAIGSRVAVRTVAGSEGARRIEGTLREADEESIVVEGEEAARRLSYAEIERAHTVFDWQKELSEQKRRAKEARGR